MKSHLRGLSRASSYSPGIKMSGSLFLIPVYLHALFLIDWIYDIYITGPEPLHPYYSVGLEIKV